MRTRWIAAGAAVAAITVLTVALPLAQNRNQNLPPGADAATAQLDASPRHGEWVDIPMRGGAATLNSFVVYPERATRAPVVIVIHEIFGMQDWVRGVADQLAKEGFIAIAPDLLSGMGPNGGGTASLGDQVGQTIRTLTNPMVVERLNAVREYALQIPSATGRVATIGFCWGGGASFNYALKQPALDAAVSYYGPMPTDPLEFVGARAPILGLYGGSDERVNANIPVAEAELAKVRASYEPHVFEGAGHGFLRAQDGQEGANMRATREAWPLTLAFLKQHTER
jgi:carboxymethylenebutenolidase